MKKNNTKTSKQQASKSSVHLLFSPKAENAKKAEITLEQQGVRVTHLTPKKPSQQNESQLSWHLMQSPAGSLYRPIQETCLGLLAKEITPEKDLVQLQKDRIESAMKENIYLHSSLEPMVQFQNINREILAEAKKIARPSTKSAMKISANQLLSGEKRKHDVLEQIDWCHLTGHQFAGATSSNNLAPGTHQSNLNTLFGIENPVAKCIRESQTIKSVETTVTARFLSTPVFPDQIEFTAKYKTEEHSTVEHFFINPQSRRSLTKSELLAIKTLRAETLEDSFDCENNHATEFHRA
jgi:DNA/RNA non-specific endonuclease